MKATLMIQIQSLSLPVPVLGSVLVFPSGVAVWMPSVRRFHSE
jgi:hypothetical protein